MARMAISNATKVAPLANGDLASAFRPCLSSFLPPSPFHSCNEEEEDRKDDENQEQENSPDKGRSQTTGESPPTLF
jgi:hypothetical protein